MFLLHAGDRCFHSCSVNMVSADKAIPFRFKLVSMFFDDWAYKLFAALDHHDEGTLLFIKIADIFTTEVTSIQDKAHPLITVSCHFIDDILKLSDVSYRTGIFLIKKRNTIVLIKDQRERLKTGNPLSSFGLPYSTMFKSPAWLFLLVES